MRAGAARVRAQGCAHIRFVLCQIMMSSRIHPCALETPDEPFNLRCQMPQRSPSNEVRNRSGNFVCCRDRARDGGARRDRTDDLMLAKHALYQLSYGPSLSRRPASARSCHRSIVRPPEGHTREECGGPRRTRTADLTLIRRVL